MQNKTIRKSIDIQAPKEKVWKVLIDDEYTRAWYAEFSEGTHAITDWQEGSKALFIDNTGEGLIGKIVKNKPAEIISIEYMGMVVKGTEDYDSDIARAIKGGLETYTLTEKDRTTQLSISCDMGEDFYDMMSAAWDKALKKIKTLSEEN